MLIHRRLGHPSFQILKCMFPEKFKKTCVDPLVCEVCEKAKHKRHSHPSTNVERRKNPFELIHCDVWGLAHLTDLHGFRWFLIFVDDFSRFTWINLLRYKSEVNLKIQQFTQMVERQFDKRIQRISLIMNSKIFALTRV